MIPKGKLLIIGGAEDKGDKVTDRDEGNPNVRHFEILQELLPSRKKKLGIEVITTASRVPGEVTKMYSSTFKKMGYDNIGYMNIESKMEARDEKILKRIEKAGTILFSGGDQFRIASILGGTPVSDLIADKYIHDKDCIVAGTSAGAMVLSKVMIAGGQISEALFLKDMKTSAGLGLLHDCVIDTHFIKRGRFARLALAVITNPGQLGIGLGEDTALIITNGRAAECRGSGMVVIIDGKDIAQTNIGEVEDCDPVFVENLRVHLLSRGCRFSITERKFGQLIKEKINGNEIM
ncbi:MAG: cyanophycinase [Bacteroidota bacterium]|nr:cyanophycinase [Bacteroidota bacterium]